LSERQEVGGVESEGKEKVGALPNRPMQSWKDFKVERRRRRLQKGRGDDGGSVRRASEREK